VSPPQIVERQNYSSLSAAINTRAAVEGYTSNQAAARQQVVASDEQKNIEAQVRLRIETIDS